MLKELEVVVEKYNSVPQKEKLDTKIVTIVVQALVGAKMEEKYGYTSDDIEAAVLTNHKVLSTDEEFADINMNIQHTMGQFLQASMDSQ